MEWNEAIPEVLVLGLVACPGIDAGTGLNMVDREYPSPMYRVWMAVGKCVEEAGLTVESAARDGLIGEIITRRGALSQVRIGVWNLDDLRTLVSVRVDEGNGDLAKALHGRLAHYLGLATGPGGHDEADLEGLYPIDMTRGLRASRMALRALVSRGQGRGARDDWAPVGVLRIRLDISKDSLKVRFSAGATGMEHDKGLAEKLRAEFERCLQDPVATKGETA
jgi:hypothetical protein